MVGSRGRRGGAVETVGRYSFAVSAVVIYLKPLAVNISSSFIHRLASFSAGWRGGGTLCYVPCRGALPNRGERRSRRTPCFPCAHRGGVDPPWKHGLGRVRQVVERWWWTLCMHGIGADFFFLEKDNEKFGHVNGMFYWVSCCSLLV